MVSFRVEQQGVDVNPGDAFLQFPEIPRPVDLRAIRQLEHKIAKPEVLIDKRTQLIQQCW